jgi:hypothetical protein
MKNDPLLQHQLRRMDAIIAARQARTGFDLSGDKAWLERATNIYHSAICRSLKRFANSI